MSPSPKSFVQSLVKIGLVVLEKIIFKFYQYIFAILLFLLSVVRRYDEGMGFPLNKLEFPSPNTYRQMNTRMTASSVEGHSEKKVT